jgi:hypothetical protein
MVHDRRDHPPQEALRRRYGGGYGAGGYPPGLVRRVGGGYGGDYEGGSAFTPLFGFRWRPAPLSLCVVQTT